MLAVVADNHQFVATERSILHPSRFKHLWSCDQGGFYVSGRNDSLFNPSSVEMVPSARHAARLERFAIREDVPLNALTDMTASLSFVKNTLSALSCLPYPCWITSFASMTHS